MPLYKGKLYTPVAPVMAEAVMVRLAVAVTCAPTMGAAVIELLTMPVR